MPSLESLTIKNIVTYKKATLDFVEPLYVIRGVNEDRKLSSKSANGVGKSLLFSSIPTVLYSAPPNAAKKNSARSMHGDGSSIFIKLRSGKKKLEVLQESHGRSLRLNVNVDGKDMQHREIVKAKEDLAKMLPIPENQFYAFNYIDVMRFHPLLKGTAAQRFEFFESVFDFDVYDVLFDKLGEKIVELDSDLRQLKWLKERHAQESADAKTVMKPKEYRKTKKRLKIAILRNDRLIKEIAEINPQVQAITAFCALAEELNCEFTQEQLETFKKDYKNLKEDARNLSKLAKDASEFERYSVALKEYEQKYLKIKESLDALGEVQKVDSEDHKLVLSVKDFEKKCRSVLEELKTVKKRIKEYSSPPFDIEAVDNTQLEEMTAKIGVIKIEYRKLKSAQKLKDSKCPSCFQPVSVKHLRSEIKRVEKEYKAAVARRNLLRNNKKAYDAFTKYKEDRRKFAELTVELKSLRKSIKKATALAGNVEKYDAYKLAKGKLSALIKPKSDIKYDEAFSDGVQSLEARSEKINSKAERLKTNYGKLKRLLGMGQRYTTLKAALADKDSLIKKMDELNNKASALSEQINELKVSVEVAKRTAEAIEKLEKETLELESKTKHYKLYKVLKEAYGARGVRLLKMEAMAKRYVENLNGLASLLYPEPMEFSCSITKGTFGIFAIRNKRPPEDVRTLSGSESRCFIALSALALASFIAPHRRFDFIIFDEIESGMDIPTRRLFMENFLPALQQAYKLIVCITPMDKSEFFSPHAKEIVIRKKNGVSKIMEVT